MYVWYYRGSANYVIVCKKFDGNTCQWYANESCWLIPGTWKE